MFLNPNREFATPPKIGAELYLGTVVANNDPKRLSRVRVRVQELHGTKSRDEDMPWASPVRNAFQGTKDGGKLGTYSVPQIGSKLYVIFHREDVLSPMYIGSPLSKSDRPDDFPEFDEGYPNSYTFHDTHGNRITVKENVVEFEHGKSGGGNLNSGTRLIIKEDGSVKVNIKGDDGGLLESDDGGVRVKAKTSANIEGGDLARMDIGSPTQGVEVTSGGVTITGATIALNGVLTSSSPSEDVAGSATINQPLTVTKPITAAGQIITCDDVIFDGGKSLKNHIHAVLQNNRGDTGPPKI